MELTKRDLRLIKLLCSYGLLSTSLIERHVFNSIAKTTVLRRLRLLEKKQLLKRVIGLESHQLLWMVTNKGARMVNLVAPKSKWSKNMLEHDNTLVGLRIALEVSGVAHSWTAEHEIRSFIFKKHGLKGMKDRIVPDAIMAIETNGYKASVALELELTLKNKTKLRRILSRYLEKGKLHALWYVAPRKSILNSVWREWMAIGGTRSEIKLYCSLLSEVMNDPLKARLMGTKPHRLIEEIWRVKRITLSAHQVSRQTENEKHILNETTDENHAPNLSFAS